MNRNGRSDPRSGPLQASREARLAAALRANLARRKAQLRERDAHDGNDQQTAEPHPPHQTPAGPSED